MTTLDSIVLDLPEAMVPVTVDDDRLGIDGVDRAATTVRESRRWLSDDGLYVLATVSPAAKPADLDPLALDLVVGETIERYRTHFDGTADSVVKIDVAGALAGRGARVHLTSASGERLELMLVAALTPDRDVVVVQATWAASLASHFADRARALGRSIAIPPA